METFNNCVTWLIVVVLYWIYSEYLRQNSISVRPLPHFNTITTPKSFQTWPMLIRPCCNSESCDWCSNEACHVSFSLVFNIHSLVFSLEGRAWQEPEPSHVTGMALAHCILGKFLGVVCHCFPPPLDVPTLATRCLWPQWRESWNCGRERCPEVILPST